MLKMCLNPKVLAGLAVVGAGIYLAAPGLLLAALPLLLLAACPLSMLIMGGAMMRGHASSEQAGAESGTYSCPMHPEVKSASPGRCPKCGMDLQPAGQKVDANGPQGEADAKELATQIEELRQQQLVMQRRLEDMHPSPAARTKAVEEAEEIARAAERN